MNNPLVNSNMRNKKLVATLLVVLFIWTGCKKEYFTTPAVDPNVPVSYSKDINPIWQSSCLGSGCHAGSLPPNLTTANSYSELLSGGYIDPTVTVPENVPLYKYLKGLDGLPVMPPSGQLPANKIDLIKTWIAQGSKNN